MTTQAFQSQSSIFEPSCSDSDIFRRLEPDRPGLVSSRRNVILSAFGTLQSPASALILKDLPFGQAAGFYSSAMMIAPVTINRPPTPLPHVNCSPKNTTANKITRATLSLSIGATREAGSDL